ncbi:tetratricopeptide repeat protein [Candidatus Poribacteria bacterium]|nr:tetratricopeptide repeat protein [Candidatus Poribacteria bacterium]
MNCKKAQSFMMDYLYGEIEPHKQATLKAHLQECPKCAEELAAHRATIATFKELRPEEPSSQLVGKVAAAAAEDIRRQESARAPRVWYWKPALAAAGIAAVVLISLAHFLPLNTRSARPVNNLIAMKKNEKTFGDQKARSMSSESVGAQRAAPSRVIDDESAGKDIIAKDREAKTSRDLGIVSSQRTESVEAQYAAPSRIAEDETVTAEGRKSATASRYDEIAPSQDAHNEAAGAKTERLGETFAAKGIPPDSKAGTEPVLGDRQQQLAFDKNIPKEYRQEERKNLASPPPSAPVGQAGLAQAGRAAEEPAPPMTAGASAPLRSDGVVVEADRMELAASPAKQQEILSDIEKTTKEKTDSVTESSKLSAAGELKQRKVPDEFARGNAYFEMRDFRRAATSYEDFIARKPQGRPAVEAMHRLGLSYQELGQFEKALSVYTEIIDNYPDYSDMGNVLMAAGDCYLTLGKTEDAIRTFEIASEKFPGLHDVARQKIEAAKEKTRITNRALPK